jgi:hypothetical protein
VAGVHGRTLVTYAPSGEWGIDSLCAQKENTIEHGVWPAAHGRQTVCRYLNVSFIYKRLQGITGAAPKVSTARTEMTAVVKISVVEPDDFIKPSHLQRQLPQGLVPVKRDQWIQPILLESHRVKRAIVIRKINDYH